MSIKTKNGYACGYCKKEFTSNTAISEAENCKESHSLIYVQLSKEDLQRLIMFIYSKNDEVLGDDIVERLQSYMKGAFTLDLESKGR
jgi:hypothetical protein